MDFAVCVGGVVYNAHKLPVSITENGEGRATVSAQRLVRRELNPNETGTFGCPFRRPGVFSVWSGGGSEAAIPLQYTNLVLARVVVHAVGQSIRAKTPLSCRNSAISQFPKRARGSP